MRRGRYRRAQRGLVERVGRLGVRGYGEHRHDDMPPNQPWPWAPQLLRHGRWRAYRGYIGPVGGRSRYARLLFAAAYSRGAFAQSGSHRREGDACRRNACPRRGGAADIQSEKEKKSAGEDRPLEATGPTDVFFGLKPMSLSVSAEGRLEVRPVRGHWGTPAANAANALFMMPSGGGAAPVQVGDLLEVEIIDPVY